MSAKININVKNVGAAISGAKFIIISEAWALLEHGNADIDANGDCEIDLTSSIVDQQKLLVVIATKNSSQVFEHTASGYSNAVVTGSVVPVTSITVSGNETLNANGTSQYTALIAPSNATNIVTTIWSVTDSSIATINQSGLLTWVSDGAVGVVATNGLVSDTFIVAAEILVVEDFTISVNDNVVTVSLWQGAPSSTVIHWGDSYSNTFAENNEHEYAQGGTFYISVNGVTKTAVIALEPLDPNDLVDFTYTVTDYTVQFYNPTGNTGTWVIDGNSVTTVDPVYVFDNGTHTVTLTGANPRTIVIDVALDQFTYVITGNSVQFTNPVGNTGYWNFGDGSALTNAVDPVHEFENGQYSVSLEGATTRPIVIYVEDAPAGTPQEGLKLIAFGDSYTDRASNHDYHGVRQANQGVSLNQSSYWVAGAYIYAESDYVFLPDQGKSGAGTLDLVNRVDKVVATEADVVIMMIGVNDTSTNGTDIEPSVTNYTSVLNSLVAGGKKVLVIPSTYRNDFADSTIANDFLDRLNARMVTVIAGIDGVEVSPLNQEYNTRLMADPNAAGYLSVSDDDLHPNIRGGLMEGKVIAASLDHFFPSFINKVNLLPASMGGTSPNLYSNASGVIPAGTTAYYAHGEGLGFEGPIDRGDGKVWWKVTLNGGTPDSYNNRAKLRFDNVQATAGMYVGALTVVIENASPLGRLSLLVNSETSTYYSSDISNNTNDPDGYEENFEYHFRTPSCRVGTTEGVNLTLDLEQGLGENCEIFFTDAMIYKVEDLPPIFTLADY